MCKNQTEEAANGAAVTGVYLDSGLGTGLTKGCQNCLTNAGVHQTGGIQVKNGLMTFSLVAV